MKILVTGATGFVGQRLIETVLQKNWHICAAMRNNKHFSFACEHYIIDDISIHTNWLPALQNCDAVVHLAGHVHTTESFSQIMLNNDEYKRINTDATKNLAQQAAKAGVKRFLFMSSIKVNGEGNELPYTEKNCPTPEGAYAQSKWAAEQSLKEIARETNMECVILRPPLIYGPQVGANFLALMRLVETKWPLPLKNISNKRSFIFVDNVVDAIITCLKHTLAANETFLVSDDTPLSTSELMTLLRTASHHSPKLFSCPTSLLKLASQCIGKKDQANKLLDSLYIDNRYIKSRLGWIPPFSTEEGLKRTMAWYTLNERNKKFMKTTGYPK